MGETKEVKIKLTLQKVPAIADWNCDGCFYKNLDCDESTARRFGPMQCTVENYIWEVKEQHDA